MRLRIKQKPKVLPRWLREQTIKSSACQIMWYGTLTPTRNRGMRSSANILSREHIRSLQCGNLDQGMTEDDRSYIWPLKYWRWSRAMRSVWSLRLCMRNLRHEDLSSRAIDREPMSFHHYRRGSYVCSARPFFLTVNADGVDGVDGLDGVAPLCRRYSFSTAPAHFLWCCSASLLVHKLCENFDIDDLKMKSLKDL